MDWLNIAGAVLSVLATCLGIVAFALSLSWVIREVIAARILFSRMTLMRELRVIAGIDVGREHKSRRRRKVWASNRERARELARGHKSTVAHELEWLKTTLGSTVAISFAPFSSDAFNRVASGYANSANLLRIRTAISGGDQPLLVRAAELATSVEEILRKQAGMVAVSEPDQSRAPSAVERVSMQVGYVSTNARQVSGFRSRVDILRLVARGKAIDHGLAVSWAIELEPSSAGPGRVQGAREYDGLLPRLRQFQFERDTSNGNYRLHLELGSIWYSEHLELNSLEARSQASSPGRDGRGKAGTQQDAELGRLLTLSTLPLTTDGYFIVAERGDVGMYPRCWGPGAGGNLEIPRHESDVNDVDANGIISPSLALAREAKEELGLDLDPDQLHPVGLIRVDSSEEIATWVLGYLALTGRTVDSVRGVMRGADPVSGRWELGERVAAIPIPTTRAQAESLVMWATGSAHVMPHLAAQVLLLCAGLRETVTAPRRPRRHYSRNYLPRGTKVFPVGVGA